MEEMEVWEERAKKLEKEIASDIITLLKSEAPRYNGYLLSQEDCQRIIDMLKVLFPDRQGRAGL